jgi:hypothetical protein
MKLTIIPSDKTIGIDENFINNVDLSTCAIPANIHALQWYETEGEVEFINNPDRTKPQNELISELPAWANACVTKWNETKAAQEAAAAEEAKLAAANSPQIPVTVITNTPTLSA